MLVDYKQAARKISIHAPREGGDHGDILKWVMVPSISIHAPREGGDTTPTTVTLPTLHFNPRPLRGGRPCVAYLEITDERFQSTPPARGATVLRSRDSVRALISIHAPREGGDINSTQGIATLLPFQSTPPARGATPHILPPAAFPCNFNPRPPRGGDAEKVRELLYQLQISIHAPREGATAQKSIKRLGQSISIHAPREGATERHPNLRMQTCHFNPRPPRGGDAEKVRELLYQLQISIHAPREGATKKVNGITWAFLFQSTPPARGATGLGFVE